MARALRERVDVCSSTVVTFLLTLPQPYSPFDFCIPQDFVRSARDGGGHAQLVYDCQLIPRVSTLGPERTGNAFQSSLTRFSPSSYVRQSMYGCFPLTLCFVGKCKTNELVIKSKEDEFVPASKLVAPPAVVWLHQCQHCLQIVVE